MRPNLNFCAALLAVLLLPAPAFAAARVQEIKTPGGITAWLVEEHNLPLLSLSLAFPGSGYAYDEDGKHGQAHLLAELMQEGAGDLNAEAFAAALEERAIHLHVGVDEDMMTAGFNTLSEKKNDAFAYLGLALEHPRFDESAIERLKDKALTDLRQLEEDPDYMLSRAWQKEAFPNHPYSNAAMGDAQSIQALTRADFTSFLANHLTRGNMLVAVVGDITPAELSALLDKTFLALPADYQPSRTIAHADVPKETADAQPTVIHHDIPQTLALIGGEGIEREDPRYYAAYVLNQVLGGQGNLTTRLGQEVREKRGLAYYIYSRLDPMLHGADWSISFASRNAEVNKAVDVTLAALRDVREKGVSAAELDDAKRYLTGAFPLSLDSNGEIASYLLAMQLHHLGRDYLERRNALIDAVTKKDVDALARTMLAPDNLHILLVGNPDDAASKTPAQ